MRQGAADQTVRAGAKSCVECRQRKIRCVRSSNVTRLGSGQWRACDHCQARGKPCTPQVSRPPSDARMTARDRIRHLEHDVASLAAIVRDRHMPSNADAPQVNGSRGDRLYDNLWSELDLVEVENSGPPSHLRLLFSTFEADSPNNGSSEDEQRSKRLIKAFTQIARAKLRPLLPLREEVCQMAEYASSWMSLYYSLFPASFAFRSKDHLIAEYVRMQHEEAPPVALALYLLFLATTAQQIPVDRVPAGFYGGEGVSRYVDAVCRIVENTIVANNAFAGTLEGLQTALLYVRLSLGRGNLKSTWLVFRRIVALSELVGLPQANDEMFRISQLSEKTPPTYPDQKGLKSRADVWEAICATDRNFSMMLNLSPSTIRYRFPRHESIWRDGLVSPQAYNYQLSNICAAVFEIDESYIRGLPHAETYEKILSADRKLRALAISATNEWWDDSKEASLDALLVKFWHFYIMARVHLRPGMMNDFDEQYAYSRTSCLTACQNAVNRFPGFRQRIPSGFFVCRVLDVQVFTAATFLLLSARSQQNRAHASNHEAEVVSDTIDLVQRVIDCFKSLSNEAGSDLAHEAMTSLSTLITLVQGQRSSQAESLTLQIPLLGKIHISAPNSPATNHGHASPGVRSNSSPGNTGYSLSDIGPLSSPTRGPDATASDVVPAHVQWSLEFDDPSFWAGSTLLPDNMLSLDNWMMDMDFENVTNPPFP